jgi:transposase-like protein
MPNKRFDEHTKAKAVRLVREHADDYDSEWAAMRAISSRLGMTAETLRKWGDTDRRAVWGRGRCGARTEIPRR